MPNRRKPDTLLSLDEISIDERWRLMTDLNADRVLLCAAKDLQDYFFESMGISLPLLLDNSNGQLPQEYVIRISADTYCNELESAAAKSYHLAVFPNSVNIYGKDSRGAAQGCYYLEDLMNLREAPFLKIGRELREPLFTPRMVHSGFGLDMFPDSYLNTITHAGMDVILIFVKAVDTTPHGYMDFNELIDRASIYGIDVYAYSYLKSKKHPDDPDAESYYDNTYGRLFRSCPGLKGVVLVGESVEFPSKDPRTSGCFYDEGTPDGLPNNKPSPGWWPCEDYPQWLNVVQKSIRRYRPDADIVFWTYNWGYVDAPERIRLIESIPKDISLLVTFEMFHKYPLENTTAICSDYTISFEGPGEYFKSEAEAASRRGLRLYTMSNTGGLTWDFGVIPYEPVPYQWIRRFQALENARKQWGLSGRMESHHYGWWPSVVSELSKWSSWSPAPDLTELSTRIAIRDFGEVQQISVCKAWEDWSEGIRYYTPTNEDQYGPFRIGPSFPLILRVPVTIPSDLNAIAGGNKICFVNYDALDHFNSSLFHQRLPAEIRSLQKMEECFLRGLRLLEGTEINISIAKQANLSNLLNLGRFMLFTIRTAIHVKKWAALRMKLFSETENSVLSQLLDEMEEIASDEIENAKQAIPIVENDSRLGWEPTMEYMTDAAHIRWKIKQVQQVLNYQLPKFRKALDYTK